MTVGKGRCRFWHNGSTDCATYVGASPRERPTGVRAGGRGERPVGQAASPFAQSRAESPMDIGLFVHSRHDAIPSTPQRMLDPSTYRCSSLLQPKLSQPPSGPLKSPTAAGFCATGLGSEVVTTGRFSLRLANSLRSLGLGPFTLQAFFAAISAHWPRSRTGRSASHSPAVLWIGSHQFVDPTCFWRPIVCPGA